MVMRNLVLFVMLVLFVETTVTAQSEVDRIIEEVLQNMVARSDEESDFSALSDYLYELSEFPLDLNTATLNDLERLPFLSQTAIHSFLDYRKKVGQLYTLWELQEIQGISADVVQYLQPFVVVKTKKKQESVNWKNVWKYGRHTLLLRGQRLLEKPVGYNKRTRQYFDTKEAYKDWLERKYQGNLWKSYARYNWMGTKQKVQIGLVAEKDAGEEWWKNNSIDHIAGFVEVNNVWKVKKLIVGDYLVHWGQGVVLWNGYAIHKSGSVLNVNKRNEGIKKYASTDENNFFRGIGLTLVPFSGVEFSTFVSRKKKDTNYTSEKDGFTSFITHGYHRNRRELLYRKNVTETVFGANVNYTYKNMKVGANFVHFVFDKTKLQTDAVRSNYDFMGMKNSNYSLYGSYRYRRMFFFSEFATDSGLRKTWLIGALLNLEERIALSLLYRDYAVGYYAPYANGFGEYGKTANEKGWYIGLTILPVAKWSVQAYIDMFESPWIKYRKNGRARGFDTNVKLSYKASEKLETYILYSHEQSQINNQQTPIKYLVDTHRNRLRLQFSYQINQVWTLKNRIAFSFFEKEAKTSQGFLVYQDVIAKFSRIPLKITTRYMLFDTDNYDTRIYTYENDVLYAYAIPAFQNKGLRFYCNLRYDLTPNLTFWCKYSLSSYFNKENLRSGLDLIAGNKIQEIKFQLRYKF